MVTEIRIYFEGDRKLRTGFAGLLQPVLDQARAKRIRFQLIAGGTTAVADFRDALVDHPGAFVILLVDSEGPVGGNPRLAPSLQPHLKHLTGVDEDQLHLMVQAMEAWFLADKDALSGYYGQAFRADRLPQNPDVEAIDKADVLNGLKKATRETQKGEYHKTGHAPNLLAAIDPARVQAAAPHCRRLFSVLQKLVSADNERGTR